MYAVPVARVIVSRNTNSREVAVHLIISDGDPEVVCEANYDEHGWSGLFLAERVGENLSLSLGVPMDLVDAKS